LAFAGAVMLLLPLRTEDQPASRLTVNRPLAVAIAVALGFFGGLVGIGGVAFILATLIYLLAVPVRIAIGTSLGIGMFAAVVAITVVVKLLVNGLGEDHPFVLLPVPVAIAAWYGGRGPGLIAAVLVPIIGTFFLGGSADIGDGIALGVVTIEAVIVVLITAGRKNA